MRGRVLKVGDTWSNGLISGDDGAQYPFSLADVVQGGAVGQGAVVDFVVTDGLARQIVVLQAGSAPTSDTAQPYSPAQSAYRADIPAAPPHLSPWGYFIRCVSTAFIQGDGRAGRTEYWSFVLIHAALLIGAIMAATLVTGIMSAGHSTPDLPDAAALFLGLFTMVVILAEVILIIPTVAVLCRRLHDINQSGFWCLLSLMPMGGLVLLVMTLMPGTSGRNRYGHPPR